MACKKVFFVLLLSCFFHQAPAQLFDSLRQSLNSKPRFHFKFDSRRSFISSEVAKIWGFKLGVDFGRKLRIGGGLQLLRSDLYKDKFIVHPETGLTDTVAAKLHLGYWSYYVEYLFYKTPRWEFSVPSQLGFGRSYYQYDYRNQSFAENKKLVIIYESAISGHYKVVKWFGLGADIGYRIMLKNNRSIKEHFNSPTYAFKFLIFYDQLFKVLFPNSKIAEKIPDM